MSLCVNLASSSIANVCLNLSSCVSHWTEAFLAMMQDSMLFAEGGKEGA